LENGSANNLSARTFGQKVADLLGQLVIVENRAGAAGNIGSQFARARPPMATRCSTAPVR
jgi:tripartite-type tricarboxylate transporter receptor subunit TctC